MALLPANPGEALWIGGQAGQNHANVGIGQGTSGGQNHTDISQSAIEDGYTDADKFFLNSDSNPVFRINAGAGRTSQNTAHPRSECRELLANGSTKAAWDGRSGTHYLKARVRIIDVTSNRPWVCFGQIHGSDSSPNTSDLIRLQTEGSNGTTTGLSLVARRTPPSGGDEIRTVLKTGYSVGDWFTYELGMYAGRLKVFINGTVVLDVTGMGQVGNYFKWGCYLQDNVEKGAAANDWAAVEFERGSLQVWHTGTPAPTTPVFTGGTDPGGGPGGGAGNDIQAPTVPQNLVGVRGNNLAALSWSASTDNVGVAGYNIYRFSASGAGGGDGSASVLGNDTGGAEETLSSADKMAASKFTAAASGTLTEGHFRAWLSASGSTLSKMAVYADDDDAPGARLAVSDEITISSTSEGVRDYVFSGANQISIEADTDYWVAASWDDPGTPSLTYSRDGDSARRVESTATYGTPSDPFGTPSGTFTGPIDAWCDVVSGTGAGTGGGGTTTTLGKTTNGASFSASSADKTAVSSATATVSGTLTAGHARAWLSATGSATTKMVVYANSSGAPGARLASSDPKVITNTAEALVDYTFSAADRISISNGVTYWIGLAWVDPDPSGSTVSLTLSRDGTASGRQEASTYAPASFGTATAQSGPMDAYIDIASGGGGGVSGGYVQIGTAGGTSYSDTGLTNATEYTFKVAAFDAAGNESALSEPVTVVPGPPDTTPPTVPTGLAATPGDGRVTLVWDASIDPSEPGEDAGGAPVGQTVEFTEGFELGGSTPFSRWNSVQNTFVDSQSGSTYNPSGRYSNTIVSMGADHPTALRTEVRDGDTAVGSHERAELSGFGQSAMLADSGQERYYEFDVRFGDASFSPTWGGGSNDWLIFFQLHQAVADGAPPLALSMHSDGKVYLEREPDDTPTADTELWTPLAGVWYQVVFHVKFSSNSSVGFVRVHVDDTEVLAKTFCQTAYTSDPNDNYPKLGTYRRSTVGGTTVVYHDNFRVSSPPETTPDAAEASGVLRYNVYADGSAVAQVAAGEGTATALVLAGLTNGTQYSFTVSAVDRSLNESAQSAAVLATPAGAATGGATLLPGRLVGGKLEVAAAFGADLAADENTWSWTDISADVRQDPGISTSLGRNDESDTSNPAQLTLVLDNRSGDYSLGTSSAHYPYVRRNTPIRVRVDPGSGGGRVVLLVFADGWTPGWLGETGQHPIVTLSASGALRRLAQGSSPLTSAYRRVMTKLSSVKAYWPFEEGRDASFAYPVRGGTPFSYTGGSPGWGSSSDFDCSAPLPTMGDGYGQADVTPYTPTGRNQVRFLLAIPDTGLTSGSVLMHISCTGTIHRWDLTYEVNAGAPVLGLYIYNESDGSRHSSHLVQFTGLNGFVGRFSLALTQSGSNIAWQVSLTPAIEGANAEFVNGTVTGRTVGIVEHFEINPHNASISAVVGHLTVENEITSLFTDNDALIAHIGDTVTGRVNGRLRRLCDENDVPISFYATGESLGIIDQMGPQMVAPLLDLLREGEVVDQGQLWDGRGAGLQYTTRRRKELGTVKLTVDATAGQLTKDFAPVDDDQRNRNRVTVTRLHGATYTYEDTAGPLGSAAIGVYDDAVTVNCYADDSLVDFARWFVRLGTVAGYRYPSVTVDLAASPELAAQVLDVVPGERITVTHLNTALAGFPDATVSLIVEGIAHEISTFRWLVTFRCSPYGPWAAGLEDNPVSTAGEIDGGLINTGTIG